MFLKIYNSKNKDNKNLFATVFLVMECFFIVIFGYSKNISVWGWKQGGVVYIDSIGKWIISAISLLLFAIEYIIIYIVERVNRTKLAGELKLKLVLESICVAISARVIRLYISESVLIEILWGILAIVIIVLSISNDKKSMEETSSTITKVIDSKILKQKSIIGYQLLSVTEENIQDKNVYKVTCEGFSVKNKNINGILNIDFVIHNDIVTKFRSVINTYRQLVICGDKEQYRIFEKVLDEYIDNIKQQLRLLETCDDVTEEHCCLARILMIYLSFKQVITSDNEAYRTFGYMGESDISLEDLSINRDIANKLLTGYKTGVLAPILLGDGTYYTFKYQKNGYKQKRNYCAFQVRVDDEISKNSETYVILLYIEDGNEKIMPYTYSAIRDIDNLVVNAIKKKEV